MNSLDRELEVAREAARLGALEVMRVYGAPFDVVFKDEAESDPVTAADHASNAAILRTLRAAFPDDAVVTEESSEENPSDDHRAPSRCWFIDPLDGTKELVARNGEFCVMIGLAIDGVARLGVVDVPVAAYSLLGGSSLTMAGATRAVLDGEPPAILTSRSRRSPRLDAIFRALGGVREVTCGSVGVKLAQILLGRAQGYVHPASEGPGPKLWDLCAPDAIARAAGLLFTDETGAPIDYRSRALAHTRGLVVAAPHLHARLLDAIARAG